MVKLSIIIVNYKVKFYLEQCLCSVQKAIIGLSAEVIVVDNNSEDDSIEYLKPRFPNITLIANKENTGFSSANNQAIAQASGEYILLLNPDTVVGEDVFQECCNFMDTHPKAGAVGVQMLDGQGFFLPESKRGFPSPWVSLCKISGLNRLFPYSHLFGGYYLKYLSHHSIQKVPILSGAYLFIRKKALDEVGLLDDTFFMYGEDIDLSYRITQGGYSNYYLPHTIIHYKGESTKKESVRYVRIFYQAMHIFFKKHYPYYSFGYKFFVRLAIFSRASVSIISRPFVALTAWRKRNKSTLINYLIIGGITSADKIAPLLTGANSIRYADWFGIYLNIPDTVQDIVFDVTYIPFAKIIAAMEQCKNKNLTFYIYSPYSQKIISSNQVIQ